MSFSIGIDIGGTKIAAALFDAQYNELAQQRRPTPQDYDELIAACVELVNGFKNVDGPVSFVGIGIPGAADHKSGLVYHAANTSALVGHNLEQDLRQKLGLDVRVANDADCAALSEAVMGAGQGFRTVFGLILGTGVGGGFVVDGKLIAGAHGLIGEIGHLPLPFRDATDGPMVLCSCGQQGCIDKTISGPGLVRLNESMTGKPSDSMTIVSDARQGDAVALQVLEKFFTISAKALILVMHAYDPEIIIVSGGLNDLPGFYQRVPELLQGFAIIKTLRVKIVPALGGAMSGLRGAALLGNVS